MNIHDSGQLEAVATHLPLPVQDKLRLLIDESAAAHAGLSHQSELAREAHAAWRQAEQDNARSHTFAKVDGQVVEQRGIFHTGAGDDGRPVYESRDEFWIQNSGARLVAQWAAWQRAKVNVPYLHARWESFAFLSDMIHWLPGNRHHSVRVPVKVKGSDHAAAVEKLREQIADIDNKYAAVELAPCAADDLVARAHNEVDRLANVGSINFDPRIREGSPVVIDWPEQAVLPAYTGIQAEKLIWLFRDEIKEKLTAKIRAETPAETMTDYERAAELSSLDADRLALERQEEAHICAAADLGQFIARRREASPLAILEVE